MLAAGALGVLLAGCRNPVAALTGGARGNALAYAACVRHHGVPDFPDPQNGGYRTQVNRDSAIVNGVTLKESPAAYATAARACRHDLGPQTAGGPPSPIVERAALAYARCMRSHGLPNFPDPRVTSHSVIAHLAGTGIDPNSAAFQAAQKVCRSLEP